MVLLHQAVGAAVAEEQARPPQEPAVGGAKGEAVVEVHDLDHQVDHVSSLLRAQGYSVRVEQDPLHKDSVVHFVYATS